MVCLKVNPSKLKMPSTPDVEYLPELKTPEREDFKFHTNPLNLMTQQLSSSPSNLPQTPDTPENTKKVSHSVKLSICFKQTYCICII